MPGETATPGKTANPNGVTGTATAATVGSNYIVTVNAVDYDWNINTLADDTVRVRSVSDDNDSDPNPLALINGTQTYTINLRTALPLTLTATDEAPGVFGSLAAAERTNVVNSEATVKLQLVLPGETATPGKTANPNGVTGTATAATVGSNYIVTVNATDLFWNVNTTADHQVHVATSDANDTEPNTQPLINGVRSFTIGFKTASPTTITATDETGGPTFTLFAHSAITVNPATATNLILFVPSETAAPGTTTGVTGSVTNAVAGASYVVTVNAVDPNWNTNTSNTNTVTLTTTDSNAVIVPTAVTLSAGTATTTITFKTASQTGWVITVIAGEV